MPAASQAKSSESGADDCEITLGLLSAIEADNRISQRALSSELGVALGLANAYLKRCVRKGLIKVQQVPQRRYAYFLTPQGFAEKTRLTAEYLSSSLQFFRRARARLNEILATCAARGLRRVALIGASEIAEIAVVAAYDHKVKLVGVVDAAMAGKKLCGLPIVAHLENLGTIDAVIWTGTSEDAAVLADLVKEFGSDCVFSPKLVAVGGRRRSGRNGVGLQAGSMPYSK